ncbi:MAG: glycosyltransferase family 8 protein [Bacteroidales bacterium]|nr:glycosyltransferase family 8 protein [Bacteroidales bacterium]MBK8881867.1 glycosyltransferase family 8 protein [Bacteroidales bacterium]
MHSIQPIVIVVACDNHYMPLLAALMKSIEVNHKSGEHIHFFILDDGIVKRNKTKLIRSVSSDIFTIHWLSMDQVIPKGMNIPYDNSSYPLIIHMRMFIPYFIPEEYEKVIYMDVDMIVRDDISKLWNTNLNDYTIGAVIDVRIREFGNSHAVENYLDLGFEASTKYFNTGLLLINTKKWREDDLTPQIFRCIEENRRFANYPDQYGLNVIFAGKWFEIDTRWSWSAEEWKSDASLIHFIWRKPIYKTYMFEKRYQEMFFQYLNLTEWKGFRPVSEFKRLIKKLLNKLLKLPLLLKR